MRDNICLLNAFYVINFFPGTGNCSRSPEFFPASEEVCNVENVCTPGLACPPEPQLSPLMTSPARDDSQSCADAKEIYCQPNQAEDSSEKQQFNDDLEDFYNEMDNVGYQCDACSSKFMSEHSLRIHAVQCNKSRILPRSPVSTGPKRLKNNDTKNTYIFIVFFFLLETIRCLSLAVLIHITMRII